MWILQAIMAVMPFEANPYLYLGDRFLGIFPDFTMIKLLGLIGLVWVVLQMVEGRGQLRVSDSSQGKAFILYLVLVVFAVIASGTSLGRLTRILSIVFFFPLVLTAVQSKDNLDVALKTAAGILILVFPYAYRQVIRFGGRLGVGLYEPNYLALALVMVLPLAVVFARQETGGWKRCFWVCGTGILFLEIIMTASRGAFLGLLVVLPLIAVRLMKGRALALSVMACLVLVPVFVIPSNMGHRILASGLSEEIVTYFLARDVVKAGPGGGVDDEDIQVHTVPLGEVASFIEERGRGDVLIDPKLYLGLYFLGLARPGEGP